MNFPIEYLEKFSKDFLDLTTTFPTIFPDKLIYKVKLSENDGVESLCRLAFLENLSKPLIKQAFDTRKIDQGTERNPRGNLQFYHRSQAFIDQEESTKIEAFTKLQEPLQNIKNKYGHEPEYLNSYARMLNETVENTLRIKEGHLDVFKPQMEYLSQLLFLRYRLTNEDLQKMTALELQNRILEKDEDLLKRGAVVQKLNNQIPITKDSNTPSPESLVQALFQSPIRKPGEKIVERQITITIKDSVID